MSREKRALESDCRQIAKLLSACMTGCLKGWRYLVKWCGVAIDAWNEMLFPSLPITAMTWSIQDGELRLNGAKYVTGRRYDRRWIADQCDPLLKVIESSGRKLSIAALAIEMPIAVALFDSQAITLRRLQNSTQEEDRLRLVVRLPNYDIPIVICNHSDMYYYEFWIEEEGRETIRVRSAAKLAEHLAIKVA